MFSVTYKSLNSLILLSLLLLFVSPKTLAQTAATADTTDNDDDDDDGDAGEVDCEYEGNVKNYLTCAKNKISTPMLIGAGIGITLGVFLLSFLCIWLTKKRRRRAAAQKDQNQDQITQQIVNVDLNDLEKNQPKEFFYPDDTKIPLPEKHTKPINPSNEDKSRSFELLAPPLPKPKHSQTPSNASSISNSSSTSNRPTVLNDGPTSLRPTPSLRKGSRDELYANSQGQPLKHAPSTRRPNPTFHKHMNQVSINGSIHDAPAPGPAQVQVSDGSGSPVQMDGKRELEITNPNPQSNPPSRQSSLSLDKDKDYRPFSSHSYPRHPEVAHHRPGEANDRRSITHLPKPTTRSSVPPPPYALGPQPPAPSAQHASNSHSTKPQMPLRGASQKTLPLPPVLEDSRVSSSPSVSSRQTTLALPKVGGETEDDGRSGTFGPDLGVAQGMKREVMARFESEEEKGTSGEKKEGGSAIEDEAKSGVTKSSSDGKVEVDVPTKPTSTSNADDSSITHRSKSENQSEVIRGESQGEAENQTKTKTKTRRKELRQTNLIPSYYVKSHGVTFADEDEAVPSAEKESEQNTQEQEREQKVKQAEEQQGKSTNEAEGGLQGDERELPNLFDKNKPSEQPAKEKNTKEKKDKKSKHKKSKKSEEKKEESRVERV
ncbi:hypothetical protein I302_103694 [Kwoniella bestiolae CBS 10118]|uniref:Uncharacterized protein n=1 Tax=Kwoniella bestiolae CBS 10118 TaxID=1296100 RepID=A0A1B9G972_9TREE|nr:hypothetical protein I302_02399 [Kwoniella bestiolae CBS 10118]OCF27557.1 hypothetical protein I302_02399 [Kwoniella bestiolae CBS 10118]